MGVGFCVTHSLADTPQGFYHADPHPGNLLRMRDGRLCYLDFGMVGGSVGQWVGHQHLHLDGGSGIRVTKWVSSASADAAVVRGLSCH
jgi:hypothetical protein